jgi:hypothetical protein
LFCPECGDELKPDDQYCVTCGKKVERREKPTPQAPPSAPDTTKPTEKTSDHPSVWRDRQSRIIIIALAIIGIAIFASTAKCIPLIRSYTIEEKYEYKYFTTDWQPAYEVACERSTYLAPFLSYSSWYQESPTFWLAAYTKIRLDVTSDSADAYVTIYMKDGDRAIGSKTGTFIAPNSGQYYLYFINLGKSYAKVTAKATITAKLESIPKTATAYINTTRYEVTYVTIVQWLMKNA